MIGLTRKQAECLEFLERHLEEHGEAPSFNEIADAINLKSKSGVNRIINGLEERGRIRRLPNRARALEIVDQSRDALRFIAPDVRRWIIHYAKINNMLPETVVAIRMREWAEHEARRVA